MTMAETWNLSKILHRRIFRLKILQRQFHLILTVLVRKNTKNEWKWRNLHRWQNFYTAAGSDGIDKFHLWMRPFWITTSFVQAWRESFHPNKRGFLSFRERFFWEIANTSKNNAFVAYKEKDTYRTDDLTAFLGSPKVSQLLPLWIFQNSSEPTGHC